MFDFTLSLWLPAKGGLIPCSSFNVHLILLVRGPSDAQLGARAASLPVQGCRTSAPIERPQPRRGAEASAGSAPWRPGDGRRRGGMATRRAGAGVVRARRGRGGGGRLYLRQGSLGRGSASGRSSASPVGLQPGAPCCEHRRRRELGPP